MPLFAIGNPSKGSQKCSRNGKEIKVLRSDIKGDKPKKEKVKRYLGEGYIRLEDYDYEAKRKKLKAMHEKAFGKKK